MTDWKCLSLCAVISRTGSLHYRLRPLHRSGWHAAIYLALCACILMTGCRLVVDPDDYAAGNGNEDGDGGPQDSDDDGGPQNGPDSSPDMPPTDPVPCEAWSPLYFDSFCDFASVPDLPAWRLPEGEYTLDTGLGTLVGPEQEVIPINGFILPYPQSESGKILPAFTVIVKQLDIERGAVLRVVGEFPLFLVSLSHITVNGSIDVSSKMNEFPLGGAGSAPAGGCDTGNGIGHDGVDGVKSGGGGGFGAPGGTGGTYSRTGSGDVVSGSGGQRIDLPLAAIRGGCSGGDGGNNRENRVSEGGRGGGAVMLTAPGRIEIGAGAWIDAGGAGGRGGRSLASDKTIFEAGAGGGAGGLIVLDAPTIVLGSEFNLAANGGGGGGPSRDFMGGGNGGDGQDGYSRPTETGSVVLTPLGGLTPNSYSGGGSGGGRDSTTGANGFGSNGGGGGGGAGYILIHATTIEAAIKNFADISTPAVICLDDMRMPEECMIQ